jgi:uncharacterized protein YbgA (DUF1722 family)/uncharacterized protein YbbK (DUF523 family)
MKDSAIIVTNQSDRNLEAKINAHKINVGLSACLAGKTVRYNGGHANSKLCMNHLTEHFNFETFCPEVAAGFGTPRPTMRLVGDPQNPTLEFTNASTDENRTDLSQQLIDGFKDKLSSFSHLHGYILMKNSPSCGLERIKVYQENGYTAKEKVSGLFTQALQRQFPLLPVEEEGRLNDPLLYENFITRVYAHSRFHEEVLNTPTLAALQAFHASYKYVLLTYHHSSYKLLGKLIADADSHDVEDVINQYFHRFMLALGKPARSEHHTNTLLHILGYLKKDVSPQARQKIADVIDIYHKGQVPLITPLTLLNHYVDQFGSDYIKTQRYLNPYPATLGLANHV